MAESDFSHLDNQGQPSMVDVVPKSITQRTAIAESRISLPKNVLNLLENGDIRTKKGAVFQTAIIAGVLAAKRTGELIPLCHPLGLENCQVEIGVVEEQVIVKCTAAVEAKTGVEMEALVGASIAALTVYDMCKSFSHDITIKETRLIQKTGGKSDFKRE
jgi:cyclic pyranopterin phosphate synthase